MLLGVRRCPIQQLVLLAAGQLDDLRNFVAAVVEDGDRGGGFDDAAQPGECVDGQRSLAPVIKIIERLNS